MKTKTSKRQVAVSMILTLLIALVAPIATNTTTVKAAVSDNGMVYDGEGTISKGNITVSLTDCIPTITVNGTKFNYPFTTRHIATAVIADDDLIHMFWLTGHYMVLDGRTTDKYLYAGYTAYDEAAMRVSYIRVDSTVDSRCVKGLTGPSYHTCLINNKYFYNNSSSMMRLMTRAEFEALRYGNTPTPVPTSVPTAVPTAIPTAVPTTVPTQVPTQVPTPVPTAVPTAVPTVAPTVFIPTMPPQPTTKATLPPLPTFAPLPTGSAAPDVVIETEVNWSTMTEIDLMIYWKEHFQGTITWEDFYKAVRHTEWNSTTNETDKYQGLIHFEYDPATGKVKDIFVDFEGIKQIVSGGSSTETETGQHVGTATIEAEREGVANVKGTVITQGHANARTTVKGKTSSSSSSKTKTSWHVKRPNAKKGYVKLTRTVNGKTGTVCGVYHNRSKKIAVWDTITTKKVAKVDYSATSHQIIYRISTGKTVKVGKKKVPLYRIKIVPRGKGNSKYKWSPRYLKGYYTDIITGPTGLALRAVNKKTGNVYGLMKVQAKKSKR